MTRRIAVVGGGLAGITAALSCADSGAAVSLFEDRSRLGGLTSSFRRGDLDVDNGQHVFLRCCKAYLRLLDRLGVADQVSIQSKLDIAVRRPGSARPARLWRNSLPAPAHLSAALLSYGALRLPDRFRVIRAAVSLAALDLDDAALDEQSFAQWLAAHGQTEASVTALWDLLIVATLNARADEASLALAAKVFQTGLFDSPDAGDIGWSRVPLQQLHGDAAERALGGAGADVLANRRVSEIRRQGSDWLIAERGGATRVVDGVVLAVGPAAAERLLPPGSVEAEPGWSQRLGSAPIVNVHVVFDSHVMDEPFFAGVNTPVQWVFDRTEQSGLTTAGSGRGQYLAVSLSAAHDVVTMSTADIRAQILPALMEVLPAARRAGVVDFFVTRERNATFAPAPGSAKFRLAARTNAPGLALAGAWTRTGWPATMEGAVLSGEAAAAVLTRDLALDTRKGPVAA